MYILLSGWFTQNWRVGGWICNKSSITSFFSWVPTRELVLKKQKITKRALVFPAAKLHAEDSDSIDFLGQLQTCSATRIKRRRKRHHTPVLRWSVWEFMSLSENSDDDCEVMNTVFNLLLMWRGYENWQVSVIFTACLCTLYSLSLCLALSLQSFSSLSGPHPRWWTGCCALAK